MRTVLHYADLDMNKVDHSLSAEGELSVSLPPKHAKALVSFIEIIRVVQGWSANKTPFVKRLPSLIKGFGVIAVILFFHARLFDLGRVVVLNSSSQTWEHQATGDVLFTFKP